MTDRRMTLDEIEALAKAALQAAGASQEAAQSVARSTRLAERDGIRSHGLLYIPIYAEHLRCGCLARLDRQPDPAAEAGIAGIAQRRPQAQAGHTDRLVDEGVQPAMGDCMTAACSDPEPIGCQGHQLRGHRVGITGAEEQRVGAAERVDALVMMDTSAGPVPGFDPALMDIACDVALDPFTSHGHDGLLNDDGYVLNEIGRAHV